MANIRMSPLAVADLQEIKAYIADELSNPAAANRIVGRIINDYSRLADAPHLGPSLSSVVPVETDYRFLVSGKYIVFYQTDSEMVSIYRILYGSRDYMKVLFGNRLTDDEEIE